MPRTISTKPAYSVRFWDKHGYVPPSRNVFELLERQAKFRYVSPLPELRGHVELTDFRDFIGSSPSVNGKPVASSLRLRTWM